MAGRHFGTPKNTPGRTYRCTGVLLMQGIPPGNGGVRVENVRLPLYDDIESQPGGTNPGCPKPS